MSGTSSVSSNSRAGNPTTESVEAVINELEGAYRTGLMPSGLAAITIAVLSCVKAGDDMLITDSAYEPESPGSLTFEVQDIPALAATAHGN
ncbi:MAG: PLP-dependent transferase [Candidatus Devosia symbiotica]|nr:PLP-dependent transferase [Candidatus Devosia symbiotica]